MLEAVNSTISNASLVRGQAEQVSQARALATNPESVQVVPQAPFISPYIRIDTNYKTAVLAVRDRDTGDFLSTVQSDARLQAQAEAVAAARAEVLAAAPQAAAPQPETPAPQPQQNPAYAAFTRQVTSLQTALSGGGTGGTVSTFA